MSSRVLVKVGVLAGLVLASVAAWQPVSAAQLHVEAAPIQTWTLADVSPELPAPTVDLSVCGPLSDYHSVITGTAGDDRLVAGNGRQVLVGLGGDDELLGGNHDDCVLGGDADDHLYGENGQDILVGGAGADLLDGGSGKDMLDAGADPGDECASAGAPDDELVGCTTPAGPESGTVMEQD